MTRKREKNKKCERTKYQECHWKTQQQNFESLGVVLLLTLNTCFIVPTWDISTTILRLYYYMNQPRVHYYAVPI